MNIDRLKAVFMGCPDFAVPSLRALAGACDVVAVVTQPDRPCGRGCKVQEPPVKIAARELGLPVLQPKTMRRKSVRLELTALGADLFVVAAFGHILRPRMLAVPPMGCVNVHASLLPRLRGAAPITWAVARGEQESGITIMQMDAGMDTGDMLLQERTALRPDETAGSLHDRLAAMGGPLLIRALEGLLDGTVMPQAQDHDLATEAPMLCKGDGEVDFERTGQQVDQWVRGMTPWPGAFTKLDGDLLKLFSSRAAGAGRGRPGEVLDCDDRGLLVACGEGAVWLGELQLAGRKRMPARALVAGRPIPAGTILGHG